MEPVFVIATAIQLYVVGGFVGRHFPIFEYPKIAYNFVSEAGKVQHLGED